MLSQALVSQFRTLAKSITESQTQFVSLYFKACEESAGNEWAEKAAETFKDVRIELRIALVDDGLLHRSSFNMYCRAAEMAIQFDLPFSTAKHCRQKDIPAIKELVATDKSDDPKAVKFARAAAKVKEIRRKEILESPAIYFPNPEGKTAEQVGLELAKAILLYVDKWDAHADRTLYGLRQVATAAVEFAKLPGEAPFLAAQLSRAKEAAGATAAVSTAV